MKPAHTPTRPPATGLGSYPVLTSGDRLLFARDGELWSAVFDRVALQLSDLRDLVLYDRGGARTTPDCVHDSTVT